MTFGIILVLIGLLALFLEFFLPGGILALTGSLFVFVGIIYFCLSSNSWFEILLFFLATSFGIVFTIMTALRVLRNGAGKRTFYQDGNQEGYIGAFFDRDLIGKRAVAATDFRPSGLILVEGKRVQAVAKTGYITKGTQVMIVSGEGAHLIVEILEE